MKKKIILGVALALLVIFAASCTQNVTPTNDPKPTSTKSSIDPSQYTFQLPEENYDFGGREYVLYSYHGQAFEQREDFIRRYALDSVIEEKYNVKISYDLDMTRGANDAIVGSPSIDLGFLGLHTLFSFRNGGGVEPLTPYFEDLHYDGTNSIRWDAEGTEWNSMGGEVYAMYPTAYELWKFHNVHVMFMNKDLLSQRGISADEIYTLQANKQWTWDKFAEYAQRVTIDTNHDDVNDIWGTTINGTVMLMGLMTSQKSNYVNYDAEAGAFVYETNDAMVKALEFILSLQTSEAARPPEAVSGINENVDVQDFMDGKIGFFPYIFQRTWQAGYFGEMSDDYGVLNFPIAEGQNDYYIQDNMGGGWAMYTQPDKAEAHLLAQFLYVYKTPLFNTEDPTDEETAYWIEAENRIRDDGSRYILELIYTGTNTIRNNNGTFEYNGLTTNMGLHNIFMGSMTVTEALETSLPICQQFMATFYDKTGAGD